MLTVFIATFVIFALVILGMSLGYLVKRKSIQGSCGGISALGLEKVCDCPEPCDARKKRLRSEARRVGTERPSWCRPRRSQCH
nr:(Na+)-NQR maturation NqrM [Klebsiella pneumoniae]